MIFYTRERNTVFLKLKQFLFSLSETERRYVQSQLINNDILGQKRVQTTFLSYTIFINLQHSGTSSQCYLQFQSDYASLLQIPWKGFLPKTTVHPNKYDFNILTLFPLTNLICPCVHARTQNCSNVAMNKSTIINFTLLCK